LLTWQYGDRAQQGSLPEILQRHLRDLGHALIDRELYLPQSWTDDADRCREAGIPKETEFASKPRLAQAMISRALEAGVPFAWPRSWQKISAGAGAHGPREYHWARIAVRPGWTRGRGHWLQARRSLHHPGEISYYTC
jgi:DDE superfamily endonuclease